MKRKSSPTSLTLHIDGAARGNPGPAGAGILLTDSNGRKLKEVSRYLGEATNNVAEWCAFILALQEAVRLGARQVTVLTDSELLARQVNGQYRVKNKQLQWLHALSQHLLEGFERVRVQHVPRGENRQADRLAGRAVQTALRHLKRPARAPSPSPAEVGQPTLFD